MKVKTKSFVKGKGIKTGRGGTTRVPLKKREGAITRKKFCRLCADKVKFLDYKDAKRLEAFIRDRGKMVPSRISGNCAKHQRKVAEAIKKARFISLLPYVR